MSLRAFVGSGSHLRLSASLRSKDCYVAVTGLPNPRKDHAIVMTRFAWDCRDIMRVTLRKLEVKLGPETGDLDLRVGIHSGPVTAGAHDVDTMTGICDVMSSYR